MAVQSISVFHFRPHFLFSAKEKKVRLEARTEFVFTIVNVQSWDGLYGRHEGTNVQLGKERALWWGFSIAILCSLFMEFTLIKVMSWRKNNNFYDS